MFYSFKLLFYNIIKFYKDITEKACLVVLHGLAGADAVGNNSVNVANHLGGSCSGLACCCWT